MSSESNLKYAPIALFCYNRLQHTQRTIEALKNNILALESDLIIFSDGPRDDRNLNDVVAVRTYLETVSGFRSIKIITRPKNIGLARSIIDGVTSVVSEYGRIIVLEDDLVTSRYFLSYMNDALNKYSVDERVISIHGYCYPVAGSLPEVFFLRGADCWGWATWKRGWDIFEQDASKLYSRLQDSGEEKVFNFDGQYPYTEMLKQQIEGKVNSWAIRWYASAFLANRLTLYPGVSLVQNIGNDNSGTHNGNTDVFKVEIASCPVLLVDIPIVANDEGYKAFKEYFATLKPSFIQSCKIKVKKFLDRWLLH